MLHLVHKLEGAETFGAGELSEVHAEVIMGRGGVGVLGDYLPAGGDASLSEFGAFGAIGGELGQVKAGPGKLPRNF